MESERFQTDLLLLRELTIFHTQIRTVVVSQLVFLFPITEGLISSWDTDCSPCSCRLWFCNVLNILVY